MPELFLSNAPHDCQEFDGFPVNPVYLVRDPIAGGSPASAYVALRDGKQDTDDIRALNGQSQRKAKGVVSA